MTSDRHEWWIAGLRVAGPAAVLGFLLWLFWSATGKTESGVLGALGLALLGGAIGFLIGIAVWWLSRSAGERIVKVITATGDLPPAPSFSFQESQAIRGNLDVARAAYEAQLHAEPGDLNSRLALARLWRDLLNDPREAEMHYLESRHWSPTPEQELAIANALIDLYRKRGDRGKEMAELARLADRCAGTLAGEQARSALRRLKQQA